MREWRVRRKLGEDGLRLVVNPSQIDYELSDYAAQRRTVALATLPGIPGRLKKILVRVNWELRDFRLTEAEFERSPISTSPIYQRMADVYEHRDRLRESQTYAEIVEAVKSRGAFKHKNYEIKSVDDVEECIRACYLDMMQSMAADGYQADRTSKFATGGIGNGVIDRDGSIVRSMAATHRMSAAKVVGLQGGFPLRIVGAHTDWLNQIGATGAGGLERFGEALRDLDLA